MEEENLGGGKRSKTARGMKEKGRQDNTMEGRKSIGYEGDERGRGTVEGKNGIKKSKRSRKKDRGKE